MWMPHIDAYAPIHVIRRRLSQHLLSCAQQMGFKLRLWQLAELLVNYFESNGAHYLLPCSVVKTFNFSAQRLRLRRLLCSSYKPVCFRIIHGSGLAQHDGLLRESARYFSLSLCQSRLAKLRRHDKLKGPVEMKVGEACELPSLRPMSIEANHFNTWHGSPSLLQVFYGQALSWSFNGSWALQTHGCNGRRRCGRSCSQKLVY
mmetsp:Transcript_22227/g.50744  ORF Transcript_22227/g.50744 Transcript_22227/m.50744 type:complete len:203 (+) Transcript_22227:374-982(+)